MNLGDTAYWEARYALEMTKLIKFKLFDWYVPFNLVYPMIESLIDASIRNGKVLIIGVGRSNIIETLYGKQLVLVLL